MPLSNTARAAIDLPADVLTHVELTWHAKRTEQRIRFGAPCQSVRLDRFRQRLSFAPDSIFAIVRWAANDYGTVLSRIDVMRAVHAGERFTTAPCVEPGGDILLSIGGWAKVERVLQAIDAIEALGIDPVGVAPEHWRHIHNRLTVGEKPRSYTLAQHRVWYKRRRIAP